MVTKKKLGGPNDWSKKQPGTLSEQDEIDKMVWERANKERQGQKFQKGGRVPTPKKPTKKSKKS
jgi:hypothetical protein